MSHTLPPLPYDFAALEPFIDAKTMELHHDKHHQAYVDKLNAALQTHPDLQEVPPEKLLQDTNALPADIRQAVINHAGGHVNHSLWWMSLSPAPPSGPVTEPKNEIGAALTQVFGKFDIFKTRFTDAATAQFGSGWAWLVLNDAKQLEIYSLLNQDSPLSRSHVPLLGLDVWEHAYYLKYQNRRPEYIEALWHVINWPTINQRYLEAIK